MKITHFGVKISIALLMLIILLSNAMFWKSISMLSDHINSLIDVSNHQENGELFHSAVHSMIVNSGNPEKREQYFESRRQADEALQRFHDYFDHGSQLDDDRLSKVIGHIGKEYSILKDLTEKMTTSKESSPGSTEERSVHKSFDDIFVYYKELFRHHNEQRIDLLEKSTTIRKSIRWLQFVMATAAIIAGLFIIFYLDRVALKLYDFTEQLALHDKLTGLYNRHGLDRIVAKVNRSVTKSGRGGYGVVLLDIDHFKQFNDSYGHPAGDRLLVQLAELLKHIVRGQDRVVRYGGEEILIFLSGTGLAGTREAANKICRVVAETPFDLLDGLEPKHVTVSIGYAAFASDHGTTFQEIIKLADQRLYHAKNKGRNMVEGP